MKERIPLFLSIYLHTYKTRLQVCRVHEEAAILELWTAFVPQRRRELGAQRRGAAAGAAATALPRPIRAQRTPRARPAKTLKYHTSR